MKTSDFDFELPEELIAKTPLPERDASRLLHLPRSGGLWHRSFVDLPQLLTLGDLLVMNDAKVIRARLLGKRVDTGGRVELLLCDPMPVREGRAIWRCMGQSSKGLRPSMRLRFTNGVHDLTAEVLVTHDEGFVDAAFDADPSALLQQVAELGELPLPPYLRRAATPEDERRYQTLFADREGAVAAPTAGLHFTEKTFRALRERDIETATITLFVGPGTFLPVRSEDVFAHKMHEERYEIPEAAAAAIERARKRGGRVIAVGTTTLRCLEAAAGKSPAINPHGGTTDLFITPGYRFRAIDGLLTNFHLPRSTLLMLVAALGGRERLLAAYAEAVAHRYRFYSYGDAMLLL